MLGYILPSVASFFRPPHLPKHLQDRWHLDEDAHTLTFLREGTRDNDASEHTAVIEQTTRAMQRSTQFKVLTRWRDELYPVYGAERELLFEIERAAAPLFGIVTYGVHMTGYIRLGEKVDDEGSEMKVWVPRRAKDKQTYAGMLDNTVAGGISSGETPFNSLVREAEEEASMPEALVRQNAKSCGTVSYFSIRDERAGGETGLLQPEIQYIYDIELPDDFVPKPGDDEVQGFELWDVERIRMALAAGEFKPNCALVMLDFFIRHGVLTPENEPDYGFIIPRLHRRLEFPTL